MRLLRTSSLLACLCILLTLSACVERKEKLVISPDGSVLWQVQHRSDSFNDLLNGDAIPTAARGWLVNQAQERDDQGNITHTLWAEAGFNVRRHALPEGFGDAGDIASGACLRFTTAITFEKRRDGVYCHFARRYHPREWTRFERIREQFLEGPLEGLDAEPGQWTPEQRIAVARALAAFEVEKRLAFLRSAWLSALPREPHDGYLAIRDDLHAFLGTLDYAALANLLAPVNDPQQQRELERAIELESAQLRSAILGRIAEAAGNLAQLSGDQTQALLAACELENRRYETTEDLNDDGFEITVDMPGPVVATNAETGPGGRNVTWRFKGEQLHDCEIELLATCRVME